MILCECGCKIEIIIKPHHSWYGTPRFITGHDSKPEENRKKMSEARKGIPSGRKGIPSGRCGEKNPNWRGGISFLPYCPKFNFQKREEIREKYGRKCFLCDKSELENGKKLDVHHIDYDKEQGCNGKTFELVPLCTSCHGRTNSKREEYRKILLDKLQSIGIMCSI